MMLIGNKCFSRRVVAPVALFLLVCFFLLIFEVPILRLFALMAPQRDVAQFHTTAASPVILDREGRILCAYLSHQGQWNFPVPLDRISPHLQQATVAVEDHRFYAHAGVDLRAVLRAAWQNLTSARNHSGASTITMQLSKRIVTSRSPLARKINQAFNALILDRVMDKPKQMELYLNSAPYGANLVGAEAASRRYFGVCAAELTLEQAAMLAGLPKSPTALNPLKNAKAVLQRRNYVLRRMFDEGYISDSSYSSAKMAPLSVSWHRYKTCAPHFAELLKESAIKASVIQSTLDRNIQLDWETKIREYLLHFDNSITNAAALVVHVPTSSVLARIGSADFSNVSIQGQFDACLAERAPGSLLKPLIYALAMKEQCLYPTEKFLDGDLDFGVYNPNNFDGEFSGMITTEEALRWSLNIPAVSILDRVGPQKATEFLRSIGFNTLRDSHDHYGLGLVLGNCEVTLESIANGYLVLARLGLFRQTSFYINQPGQFSETRVLPESVAYAVCRMLEQPFPWEPYGDLIRPSAGTSPACWKTGTSTGFHDAWAVVFDSEHLVAVWLGNNNGKSSERLIGAHAALPLAASILRSLPLSQSGFFESRADLLHDVQVCSVSGLPKSEWCPVCVTARLPKEQFLHRTCAMHRVSRNGNVELRYPPSAKQWDLADIQAVYEPPETETPSKYNDITLTQLPYKKALSITSPANNATYVLSGIGGDDRLLLEANLRTEELNWYQDERYLGKTIPGDTLFLTLLPGEHRISCMSKTGKTDCVSFTVCAQ